MGASVLAVEEVRAYAECLEYLKRAFAVDSLEIRAASLYELTVHEIQDSFDFDLLAGVLYHVTDPVVALRLVFNALKDGGTCLLETTAFRHRAPVISYARRRWNWFDPSPDALSLMLSDVGFGAIELGELTRDYNVHRVYATARRDRHVDMRRDGLSMPGVR